MKKTFQLLALLAFLFLMGTSVKATTWTVNPGESIQAIVNGAAGGDIITINPGTYTQKVNIPAGKNGLVIQGANRTTTIIDGASIALPAIAFTISSDDVVIKDLTIRNFNNTYYAGLFDPDDFSNYGGAAIYATFNKTNLSIEGNIIYNCNWGIYLSEPVNCSVTGNNIHDIMRHNPFAPEWTGGVGIMAVSTGADIEGNIIGGNGALANTIANCHIYGIWLGVPDISGSPAPNVSADGTIIKGNTISDCHNAENAAYGVGVKNITGILSVEYNTFNGNDRCLFIDATFDNYSCEDVSAHHNKFYNTLTSVEIEAGTYFSGEKLYDIWRDRFNSFDEVDAVVSSDEFTPTEPSTKGSVALLDETEDIILPSNTSTPQNKFIRNTIHDVVTIDAWGITNARVEVLPGKYDENEIAIDACIGMNLVGVGTFKPKIVIPTTASSAAAWTSITVLASSSDVDIHNFRFELSNPNPLYRRVAIDVQATNTEIYDNYFYNMRSNIIFAENTFIFVPGTFDAAYLNVHDNLFASSALLTNKSFYTGVEIANFTPMGPLFIQNNTFEGRMHKGVYVATSNLGIQPIPDEPAWKTYINCNTFNVQKISDVFTNTTYLTAIELDGAVSSTFIDITRNDFTSDVAIVDVPVYAINALAGTYTDINILNNNFGNATVGINVAQPVGFEIYQNNFTGPFIDRVPNPDVISYAVVNGFAGAWLDADDNWWNCPEGPYSTTGLVSACDVNTRARYMGKVIVAPWLSDGTPANLADGCMHGFVPANPGSSYFPIWTSTVDDKTGTDPLVITGYFPTIKDAYLSLFEAGHEFDQFIFVKPGTYIEEGVEFELGSTVLTDPEIMVVAVGSAPSNDPDYYADPTETVVMPDKNYVGPLPAPTEWYIIWNGGVGFENFTFNGDNKITGYGFACYNDNSLVDPTVGIFINCNFNNFQGITNYSCATVGAASGATGDVQLVVIDSKFQGNQTGVGVGTMIDAGFLGPNTEGYVIGNDIIGYGNSTEDHQIGVYSGNGAVVTIYDNKFSNFNTQIVNTNNGPFPSFAVWVDNYFGLGDLASAIVYQNDIQGNGVFIGSGAGDLSVAVISENKFYAGTYAIMHNGGSAIDATENYWASNDGPIHAQNTFNVANHVTSIVDPNNLVDYAPWWIDMPSLGTNLNDPLVTKPDHVILPTTGADFIGEVWAPVVSKDDLNNPPIGYFSSIQTAVNAYVVGNPDDIVQLMPLPYNAAGLFTENVLADKDGLMFARYDQPNSVTVRGAAAGATFQVTSDNNFIWNLNLESFGANATDYPVYLNGGSATTFMLQENNITSTGSPVSCVYVRPQDDALVDLNYGVLQFIENNFTFDNNDIAIDFNPEIGAGISTQVFVFDNNFIASGADHTALRIGKFDQSIITYNTIPSECQFYVGNGTIPGANQLFINTNTFPAVGAGINGLVFFRDPQDVVNESIGFISIQGNTFDGRDNAVYFYSQLAPDQYTLVDANLNYTNTFINNNNFTNYDLSKVAMFAGYQLHGTINAIENYWGGIGTEGGENGPRTDFLAASNALGFSYVNTFNWDKQYARVSTYNGVNYGSAKFNIVPWWSTVTLDPISGLPTDGTSWAPIWNDDNFLASNMNDILNQTTDGVGSEIFVCDGVYNEYVVVNKEDIGIIGKLFPRDVDLDLAQVIAAPNTIEPGVNGANDVCPSFIYSYPFTLVPANLDRLFDIKADYVYIYGICFDLTKTFAALPTSVAKKAISYADGASQSYHIIGYCDFLLGNTGVGITNELNGSANDLMIGFNNFTANSVSAKALYSKANGGGISNLEVFHNIFTKARNDFELGTSNNLSNFAIIRNQFDENACGFYFDNPSSSAATLSGILFEQNSFTDNPALPNDFAIRFSANVTNANIPAGDWFSEVNVNSNSFNYPKVTSGPEFPAFGFVNSAFVPTTPINAQCNWWGSVDGPTCVQNTGSLATGASCSQGVTVATWLTSGLEDPSSDGIGWVADPSVQCDGWWVYVSSDATGDETFAAKYFGALQEAINDPLTTANDQVYVKATALMQEDVITMSKTITLHAFPKIPCDISSPLPTLPQTVKVNGYLVMDGTHDLYLGDHAEFEKANSLGHALEFLTGNSMIYLENYDLNLYGNTFGGVSNAVYKSYVNTNGSGSLVFKNVQRYVNYEFPIGLFGTPTHYCPVNVDLNAEIPANQSISARVILTNPVDYIVCDGESWGVNTNPVSAMWFLNGPSNADANITFRYPTAIRPVPFNIAQAYGARWKLGVKPTDYCNPMENCTDIDDVLDFIEMGEGADYVSPYSNPWQSFRTQSSAQGSAGTLVSHVNDFSPWAIFWGPSSYATTKEPLVQASNIMFTDASDNSMSIRWTRGDGIRRIVVAKPSISEPPAAGFSGIDMPVEGTDYKVEQYDGSKVVGNNVSTVNFADCPATYTGSAARVVYDGTGNTLTLNGLESGVYYKFQVYEYNGSGDQINYNHTDVQVIAGVYTNPRHRKTMPACSLSVVSTGGTLEDVYGHSLIICAPNTSAYLRWVFTGSAGTTVPPSGWKLKYSNGFVSTQITPNPQQSPYVNLVTVPNLYGVSQYSIVSAFDGEGKICVPYHASPTGFLNNDNYFATYGENGFVKVTRNTGGSFASIDQITPPAPTHICVGSDVTLQAVANTYPLATTTVTWQRRELNGAIWENVATVPSNVYTPPTTLVTTLTIPSVTYNENNYEYRVMFSNGDAICTNPLTTPGVFYTDPISFIVDAASIAGSVPVSQTVCNGSTNITYASDVTGAVYTTKVWQYKSPVMPDFENVSSGLTIAYHFDANNDLVLDGPVDLALHNGYLFRAVYTNGVCGSAYAPAVGGAALNIVPNPTFTGYTTPNPTTVCASDPAASIVITASGSNFTNVVWYRNANVQPITAENTTTQINIVTDPVAGTSTLTLSNIDPSWNGSTFRVNFYNTAINCPYEVPTSSGPITVLAAPVITNQPDNAIICGIGAGNPANTVTFAIEGSNYDPALTIWYVNGNPVTLGTAITNNMGGIITDVLVNSAGSSLTFTDVPTSWNGYTVYARLDNGACSQISTTATLQVNTIITVTGNPTNQTICAGGMVLFTASANANPAPNAQWYYYDGTIWQELNPGTLFGAVVVINTTVLGGNTTTVLQLSSLNNAWWNGRQVKASFTDPNTGAGGCALSETSVASIIINPQPVAPAAIVASDAWSTKFTLSGWYAPFTDNYTVQVFSDAAFTNLVTETTTTAVTWELANGTLTKNTPYWYRVRSNNICGSSAWVTGGPFYTTNPRIVVSTNELYFGEIKQNYCSPNYQTYTITGYELDEPINLTTVANVATLGISLSSGGYTPTLTLNYDANRNVAPTTIYVQFCTPADPAYCAQEWSPEVDNSTFNADMEIVTTFGFVVSEEPSLQATDLKFSNDNNNSIRVSWTNGNGTKRIVVAYQGDLGSAANWTWTPIDGIQYNANAYNSAIGGYQVVYNNGGSFADVTGLLPNTVYWFRVFEYSECGVSPTWRNYLTTGNNANMPKYFSISDLFTPQASYIGIPESGVIFPAGNHVVINAKKRNGSPYTAGSPAFMVTKGDIALAGNVYYFNGASWSNTIIGTILNGASSYEFDQFRWGDSYHGVNNAFLRVDPVATPSDWFGAAGNTFNIWANEPIDQARTINWVGTVYPTQITLGWTKGKNGTTPLSALNTTNTYSLLVAKDGATPDSPAEWTGYTPLPVYNGNSCNFGDRLDAANAASEIGTNTWILYKGYGNQWTITGLEALHTYHFRIFAFNGDVTAVGPNVNVNYNHYTGSYNPRPRTMPSSKLSAGLAVQVSGYNVRSYSNNAWATWRTDLEQGISGFEVNRLDLSDDNAQFVQVGTYQLNSELVGMGYNNEGRSYQFIDKDHKLQVGNTYLYQLVAVFVDGTREEIQEEAVTIMSLPNEETTLSLSEIYPNPVSTNLNFDVTISKDMPVTVEVLDMTGRKVAVLLNNTAMNAGINSLSLTLDDISSGVYMLNVIAGDENVVKRFVVVK